MAIWEAARIWLLLLAAVQAMINDKRNEAVTEHQELMGNAPQNVQDCCNNWCSGPHCFYSNCNSWTHKYSTGGSLVLVTTLLVLPPQCVKGDLDLSARVLAR
jgi:hypothetical protein